MLLGATLERAGHQVSILDHDYDVRANGSLLGRLAGSEPDLIGIPVFSTGLRHASHFLADARRHCPKSRIVLGGPQATADPIGVLGLFPEAQFVLRGEADESIVALASALHGGSDLSVVPGLTFREGTELIRNEDARLPTNLDALPLPARHLLFHAYKAGTYWRAGFRGPTDTVSTSRGCPFGCRFCYRISSRYRSRSAEAVVQELVSIRQRGIRNIHIVDDLFVLERDRCLAICDAIRELNIGLRMKVRARVDCVDEELLRALKSAGVRTIVYGIESGSQRMLDAMAKRATVEQNIAVSLFS